MLLPTGNEYVSGEVTVFEALVREGENKAYIELTPRLHAFLVSCLLAHLTDTGLFDQVLALGFLQARTGSGGVANERLKRIGDIALILAGLFPQRARKMNVSPAYLREVGEGAYMGLGDRFLRSDNRERALLYGEVHASLSF